MAHREQPMTTIRITAGDVSALAELRDSPTARKIIEALPIEGVAQRWGKEVYFAIPVSADLEPDARDRVEVGELGYWPEGEAFCIFFGPTPASSGAQPVAASPVNILGRVTGDAAVFDAVKRGTTVRLEKAGR